ncbi:MAG: 2-phospho-L-lactate guanylyltransferase [Pseudaminobacter sp.]
MTNSRKRGGIWALVPVKRLDRAKSRLAPVLDADERKTLATAMLCDVLGTVSHVDGLSGILVVTGDGQAASIAAGFGATVVSDPVEGGLNAAVRHGMRWLDAEHEAGAIVVPGDVPFVTSAELGAVLGAMRSSQIVIAPARRDGGTNILAMKPPSLLAPSFGPDSFARHVAGARALGIEPRTLMLEGAGHDIDVASDLAFYEGEGLANRTRACIGRFAGMGFPVPAGSFKEVLLP